MDRTEPRHPINYVAKRTGLSTHVIRVWERRYGAVKPVRTETNRRLYSDADIDRLRLLRAVTEAGHSIGHIAALSDEELWALAAASSVLPARIATGIPTPEPGEFQAVTASAADFLGRCQEAVGAMDGRALESALLEASLSLNQFRLLDELVGPLMRWVGEQWHDGHLRVAHEHLASAIVRTFLSNVRAAYSQNGTAPVLLVATPSGQYHEIGAELAAALAAMEGWHEVYFGPNLPVQEIANAARESRARLVALGISYIADRPSLLREIQELRRFLPESVPLVLGGAAATEHREAFERMGAYCAADLAEFREVLRQVAAGGQAQSSPSRPDEHGNGHGNGNS